MNDRPHWTLNRFTGSIQCSPLAGVCDALRPAEGIESVSMESHELSGARLLAPSLPTVEAGSAALPEVFARGDDLAAIYPPTPEFPFRTQAYWRLNTNDTVAGGRYPLLASCELIASTQTDLLDSRPDIFVTSTLPVKQVFQLIDSESARFQEIDPATNSHEFTPSAGLSCLLFRLTAKPICYAEIVFPRDFNGTRLEFRETGDHLLATVRHHLFANRLEKGVVLRSRVLGLWMPAEADFQTTVAHYLAFAHSDPPLTA